MRSLLVLENNTCSHAEIKKSCFETIESCFINAVGGNFCKASFVNCLLNSNPGIDIGNQAIYDAFWEATLGNKNAAFIAYIFNKIIKMSPSTAIGSFTWHQLTLLKENIEELLLMKPDPRDELIDNFNKIWPELE